MNQEILAIPLRHRSVRLQATMCDNACSVQPFNRYFRFLEGFIGITLGSFGSGSRPLSGAARIVVDYQVRELLVDDLDGSNSIFGGGLIHCGNSNDFVAHPLNL